MEERLFLACEGITVSSCFCAVGKVWQNNSSPLSVKIEQHSSGSENKSQGSKQTSPVLSASKDRSAGSDSDSTMGDVSSRSITR